MKEDKRTTETGKTTEVAGLNERLVMREYSQGVCQDGAAILCNGSRITIEQVLARLRTLEVVRGVIYDSPELNPSNYDHDDACRMNTAMCEAWSIIEADA